MKRFLSIIVSTIILTLCMNELSVTAATWQEQVRKEMKELHQLGIVDKDDTSSTYLNEPISRGEFAAMVARSLILPEGDVTFSDVPSSHPYYADINKAASNGIINGIGNGKFAPDRNLTREEMAALVDRSIRLRGLERERSPLPFSDVATIKLLDSVEHLYQWEIINGFPDNTFRPKEKVTRVQSAHTVYRMIGMLKEFELEKKREEEEQKRKEEEEKREEEENEQKPDKPEATGLYDIAVIENGKDIKKMKSFNTYDEAKRALTNDSKQVILYNGEVVWMREGLAVTKQYTKIYEEDFKQFKNYVAEGSELTFIDADEDKIKVKLVGTEGYVRHSDVVLIPEALEGNRAYYKVQDGNLIHVLYRNNRFESYVYGRAPSFIKEGEQARSSNGINFNNGVYYQYFNYLPLRTKTTYTAEDLDRYIRSVKPDSPLIGLGKSFKKAEAEYGVNALYLMAHAIHESAWGTSQVAQQKKNLYGIKAIDSDPLNNATGYKTFEESVMYAGEYVKGRYLTPGSIYRGGILGNKGVGMNVTYASDPFWGQKISGHMYRADKFLGKRDYGNYQFAVITVDGLNVREQANSNSSALYQIAKQGMTVAVLEEVKNEEGLWYKIIPDNNEASEAFIYADGKFGTFAKKIAVE